MNIDDPAMVQDRKAFEARMAELGPDEVRRLQGMGAFPTGHNVLINEWLGRGGKPRPDEEPKDAT
jgi:hypothetical protein